MQMRLSSLELRVLSFEMRVVPRERLKSMVDTQSHEKLLRRSWKNNGKSTCSNYQLSKLKYKWKTIELVWSDYPWYMYYKSCCFGTQPGLNRIVENVGFLQDDLPVIYNFQTCHFSDSCESRLSSLKTTLILGGKTHNERNKTRLVTYFWAVPYYDWEWWYFLRCPRAMPRSVLWKDYW